MGGLVIRAHRGRVQACAQARAHAGNERGLGARYHVRVRLQGTRYTDQDWEYDVQLVSAGGVCVTGDSGGGFDGVGSEPGFVGRRCGLRRGGREHGSPLVLRASCRVHGGPVFELDAGSGLGLTGAALASAGMARLSCAWPHILEWVEDGLRAARLDQFRGIGCVESCVGGILKFFKETILRRRSPK